MKYYFYILFFLIFIAKANAQFDDGRIVLAPSPNAAASLKYATTPVNNYTGIPSISAPLYNLKGRGFSIPLGISYHASGVKVQDIASSVGLGWSMGTNCVIARVVRGLPDESNKGYFGSDMGAKVYEPMTTQTLFDISNGQADAEPDLFYYSINGLYGKFVFNKDKVPLMLANDGIRILNSPFKKELGVDGWVLSDLLGNKFFFGSDNSSIENTQSTIYGETSNITLNYASSWFMTKIVTLNETETINYNYEVGGEVRFKQYRSRNKFMNKTTTTFNRPIYFIGIPIREWSVDVQVEVIGRKTWNDNIEDIISAPKYLKSITSSNETAYFFYGADTRRDLVNGLILNQIIVKGLDGANIQDFRFQYKYIDSENDKVKNLAMTNRAMTSFINASLTFGDNNLYNKGMALGELKNKIDILNDWDYYLQYCAISGKSPDFQKPEQQDLTRLFLTEIDSYSKDGNANLPIYRFSYNEQQKLPKRTSIQVDHWGYFNDNNLDTTFPYNVTESANYKNSDPINSQAGILKKIIYSTGSYKDFNYELNDAYNTSTGITKSGGGLRIKNITEVPGYNSAPIIRKYKYKKNGISSGRMLIPDPIYVSYIEHSMNTLFAPVINFQPVGMPQYNFTQMRGDLVTPIPAGQNLLNSLVSSLPNLFNGGPSNTVMYSPYIIASTTSLNSIYDLDGNAVGYDEVTIENGDEGLTVYKYTNAADYPDYSNQARINGQFIATSRLSPNVSPFTPTTSYAFARGLPKEILTYNNKNFMLKRKVYKYKFNTVADSVRGFRCAIGKINTTNGIFESYSTSFFNIGYYHMVAKPILLSEILEKNFVESQNDSLIQKKTFTYDENNPALLVKEEAINSDGTSLSNEYKYAAHYSSIEGYSNSEIVGAASLVQKNAIGVILDRKYKNGNEIVGRSLVGYENFNNSGKNQTFERNTYDGKGNNLEHKLSYVYNEFGNLEQTQILHGSTSLIKWNKDNVYPILEVKNAKSNEVFIEDFENNLSATVGQANSGSRFLTGDFSCTYVPVNNKEYKILYWYRLNGIWECSGWQKYLGSGMILSQGDAVDDVIIIPVNSLSNYFTYLNHGLKSSTNNSGKTEFYNYDGFNRLTTVRDYNRDIIKHTVYNDVSNYVGDVFFSDEFKASFIRNNCGADFTSEPIEYRVPESKYFSYLGKNDANNKALADLNENGQAYANRNGICQQSAQYSLYYSTDPYFQYATCTVVKSFQDYKNATITLRLRHDGFNGQTYESYGYMTVDASSVEATEYFEVRAATYCDIEILSINFY